MSSQTTLTKDAPMILDATCSYGRFWPAHASLRMDIRREVKPDVVASAAYLPFKAGVFDTIYCDPPHMIRNSPIDLPHLRQMGRMKHNDFRTSFDRYGWWKSRDEWLDFLVRVNVEFRATLKDSGTLHFKVTSTKAMTQAEEVRTALTKFSLKEESSRSSWSDTGHKNPVHFLTMKPLEDSSVSATQPGREAFGHISPPESPDIQQGKVRALKGRSATLGPLPDPNPRSER